MLTEYFLKYCGFVSRTILLNLYLEEKKMYSSKQSPTTITIEIPKKESQKLPRPVIVLFLMFLYIFGIDFGIKRIFNKKIGAVTNGVQLLMFFVMSTILFTTLTQAKPNETHFFFFAFSYLVHWAIAFRCDYNVCDLMIDINSIIDDKEVSVQNNVEILTYIYMFMNCCLKFTICTAGCVVYYEECSSLTTPAYIYCIPAGVMDGLTIIPIFSSYYIYLSVKYIEQSLNKIDTKILQVNYMTIANCWDKIKPLHNKMVSRYYFWFSLNDSFYLVYYFCIRE